MIFVGMLPIELSVKSIREQLRIPDCRFWTAVKRLMGIPSVLEAGMDREREVGSSASAPH